MGISNTIPPSRLIQPGVVANTAARPTSPFTGQAIYQVDTNQYLIWNGTAWVIPNTPAQNPTGLELITTATCTSGGTASGGVITIGSAVSSVTVATAFSATYDNYRIVISNVTGPNNTDYGIAFEASGTNHRFVGWYMAFTGTTLTPTYSNGYSFIPVSWASSSTAYNSFASFDVLGPYLPIVPRVISPWTGSGFSGHYSGLWADTTSVTGFIIKPASGTLTGGTIRVYGYRNT